MLVPANHPGFVRSCVEYCWRFVTCKNSVQSDSAISNSKTLSFHTKLTLYALCLILSASWITSLLRALLQKTTLSGVLLAIAFVECCFYLYQRNRYQEVNRQLESPADDLHAAGRIIDNLLSHDVPIDQFLSGWFHNTPIHKIKRGNMLDFLSYGLFYNRFGNLTVDVRQKVLKTLAFIENKLKCRFEYGHNVSLRYMAHLWEPLRVLHMPLVIYLVTEILAAVAGLCMLCCGFEQFRHNGVKYWVRAPRCKSELRRRSRISDSFSPMDDLTWSQSANITPIVFLHGVLGIVGCIPLLLQLLRVSDNRPMLVVDMPHVSIRLTRQAKSVDEIATCIAEIMVGLGWAQASMVGHSYGTFVISRVYQKFPKVVASMVLLEPVAMLTCWPDLLQNFIYATPTLADLTSLRGLKYCLRWYASRELTMAQTFCRKFCWSELILWPQDMPADTLLVLSEADDLVPSALVTALCNNLKRGRILTRKNGTHGDILLNLKWQHAVMAEVSAILASHSNTLATLQ